MLRPTFFDLKNVDRTEARHMASCIAGSSRSLQTSGPLIHSRRKLTKMYFLLGWNACIWPGLRFAFEALPNMGGMGDSLTGEEWGTA
jgi:hypothetical protein